MPEKATIEKNRKQARQEQILELPKKKTPNRKKTATARKASSEASATGRKRQTRAIS